MVLGCWTTISQWQKVKEKGSNTQYLDFGYERLSAKQIDSFVKTDDYEEFSKNLMLERSNRPPALRDLLATLDLGKCKTKDDFMRELKAYDFTATNRNSANMPTSKI